LLIFARIYIKRIAQIVQNAENKTNLLKNAKEYAILYWAIMGPYGFCKISKKEKI